MVNPGSFAPIQLARKLKFYLPESQFVDMVFPEIRGGRVFPGGVANKYTALARAAINGRRFSVWELIWTECVRLGLAFGLIGLVILFWYWLMDSLGTF